MNASLEDLLRQARWLRFSDTATEARYDEDRFVSGMVRERVTMAACALTSAAFGLLEAHLSHGLYEFPGLMMTVHAVRFYAVIPLWVALCLATFWRGFPRWAGIANAVVTVLSCWGHSIIAWEVLRALPERNLTNMLTGSTLLVLIVALLMLPMRFRALVGVVALSLGGTLGFSHAMLGGEPVHATNLANASFSLPLVAVLILIGGWFREAADRRMFAQREHARRLAEELAAANAELARLNAEKNEFMAIAAHDLRAPLATVRGFAELLRDGRLGEEEKRVTAVHEIHAQATRMLGLVTDYLGAHAAESGTVPVRSERIDLAAEACAACERHELTAAGKQQLISGPNGASPVWVCADPGLLAQVTDNFISNALKFSPRGASIRLEVGRRGDVASLAVIDTGPGIPADEQAGLFQKFGRTSARPTDGEASHGLGLALAKRLAHAMGGQVGCESPVTGRRPGETERGARFWIELPAVEQATANSTEE
ncbi:sensor histidine kinase [Opitutus terrae]|uniref:sensor histidine kinase n=1 Tax=Opitutus terrae TaxID=107709 RepID=UPI0003231700|nr:HAMP domain-containing sensor histidine kinase [Opitutus terrae]